MRLTTRLMQLASWLLLQRAVNEGEMSREQAGSDKEQGAPGQAQQRDGRPCLGRPAGIPARTLSNVPPACRNASSISTRCSTAIEEAAPQEEANNDNPVASQINQLHAAFGKIG